MKRIDSAYIIRREDVNQMIAKSDRRDKKVLIAILFLTGARVSEALMLRKKDFRVREDKLLIRKPVLKRREVYNHTVPISINSPFVKSIIGYINELDDEEDKLFNFKRTSAWIYIKKVSPDAYPHLFRHSKLTRLAEMGATEYQIQTFAGMKDSRTPSNYVKTSGKLIEPLAEVV